MSAAFRSGSVLTGKYGYPAQFAELGWTEGEEFGGGTTIPLPTDSLTTAAARNWQIQEIGLTATITFELKGENLTSGGGGAEGEVIVSIPLSAGGAPLPGPDFTASVCPSRGRVETGQVQVATLRCIHFPEGGGDPVFALKPINLSYEVRASFERYLGIGGDTNEYWAAAGFAVELALIVPDGWSYGFTGGEVVYPFPNLWSSVWSTAAGLRQRSVLFFDRPVVIVSSFPEAVGSQESRCELSGLEVQPVAHYQPRNPL